MKILLINPPDDLESLIGGGSAFISNLEPLGLLYIAAVCREAGYDVSVIDAYAERLSDKDIKERIAQITPDVVGFTSFTSNGGFLYNFGQEIKNEFSDLTVVFGNVHASVYAEQYLRNKCCDVVVHGEGEYTFLRFLDSFPNKKKWREVPSISFLDNEDFVTTSPPSVVQDLSQLPMPARDLVKQDLYKIGEINNFTLHMENRDKARKHMFTSRGCPNNCTFCVVHHDKKQRFNSIKKSVDEMEVLINDYNTGYIFFMDSLFISRKKRILELCEEIESRKLDFKWGCEAHVRFIDKELVKSMESAGCVDMNFGIESGVQRLLKAIRKNVSLDMIESAMKTVKEHSGIKITGLFILGLPGETPEDSIQTIKFAKKLPIDMAQFTILTPYPGSPLFNELREKGELDTGIRENGTIDPSVWQRYSAYISYTKNMPIWVTPEQSPDGLKKLQKKALRDFYFRPRPFWTQMKRVRFSNLSMLTKAFKDTFF